MQIPAASAIPHISQRRLRIQAICTGGHNVGYDARNRAFALCPLKGELVHAMVVGKYGDAPWNQLYERPIPLFRFSERIPLEYTEKEGTYVAKLSHAMQFEPGSACALQGAR